MRLVVGLTAGGADAPAGHREDLSRARGSRMVSEIAFVWENWAPGARSVCLAHSADLRLHDRQGMSRPGATAIAAESLPGSAPRSRLDTGIMQAHRSNIARRDAAIKSVCLSDDIRLAERPSRAVQDWQSDEEVLAAAGISSTVAPPPRAPAPDGSFRCPASRGRGGRSEAAHDGPDPPARRPRRSTRRRQ